jgi:hypothetical protein
MVTYIASRDALADACNLMDRFGADAALEAGVRAEGARDRGNVCDSAIGGRSSG